MSTPDVLTQGKRLLELAAAYRVARRKKFEASDDDFPAACVTLLKATNALLAAALDCTDECGRYAPSREFADRFARLLGYTIEELA